MSESPPYNSPPHDNTLQFHIIHITDNTKLRVNVLKNVFIIC